MISADRAREVADAGLQALRCQRDRLVESWRDAAMGEPMLVHEVRGSPAYWLVPMVVERRVVGFARVGLDAQLGAIGVTCRSMQALHECPALVSGLSADEAVRCVKEQARLEPGEEAGTGRFVHDGPVGREAWLVETQRDGIAHRWFFVTRAGMYERPAGRLAGGIGFE